MTAMNTYWTQTLFAALHPVAAVTGGAGLVGLFVLVSWYWFRGSEKAQGCAQPFLWVIAGLGVLMVVTVGVDLVVTEYSKSNPRASEDGLLLLLVLGVLAVFGVLLWVGRTTEGSRILEFVWLVVRFIPIALFVGLLLIGILFGFPKRH